jgi:hypothetical protein
MAVAALLRLADADLRDAAVLASERRPGNAPALAGQAVVGMVDAVMATETGWKGSSFSGDLAAVPEQNPLKASLARVAGLLPKSMPPVPTAAGIAPAPPDHEALRLGMTAARAVLNELAGRFNVELSGDGPAGKTEPARFEAPARDKSPALRSAKQAGLTEAAPAKAKAGPTASESARHRTAVLRAQPPLSPGRSAAPQPSKLAASVKPAAPPPSQQRKTTARPPSAKPTVRPVAMPAIPKRPASATAVHQSAEPRRVVGRSPIEPSPRIGGTASTLFWSLMDRWDVPDTAALKLIGHPGGLTKKGTRPRFRLANDKVDMLAGLEEIDAGLSALKLDPRSWIHHPAREVPFRGATPLAYMTEARMAGVRETLRFILRHGLTMSMST